MFHVNPPRITANKRFPRWDIAFHYVIPKERIQYAHIEHYEITISVSLGGNSLLSYINKHLYKMGKCTSRVVEEIVNDTL
jgi:hypothetical protein